MCQFLKILWNKNLLELLRESVIFIIGFDRHNSFLHHMFFTM